MMLEKKQSGSFISNTEGRSVYVFRVWRDEEKRVHWKSYSAVNQSYRLVRVFCPVDFGMFSGSELDVSLRFLESVRLCEFYGDKSYDSAILYSLSLSHPENGISPFVRFLATMLYRSATGHINVAFFDGSFGDSWLAAHVRLIGAVLRDLYAQSIPSIED